MNSKRKTFKLVIGLILAVVFIWFVVTVLVQTNWDKTYEMGETVSLNVKAEEEFVICVSSNGSTGYSKDISNEHDLKHVRLCEITFMPVYPIFFEGMMGKGGYKKFYITGLTPGVDTIKLTGKIHRQVEANDSSLFIVRVGE